ncbi:Maintenance of ploidy protein mob2 [Polyrhizophydium stewartii]|uniref:Maintenance of ploidy protein mob2 n=1 Tax=Polyrhizophydium stewartii TaxID=2732419 RepID=A0ABR4NKI4_9FUNG
MNFFGGKFGRSKREGAKPLFLCQPFSSASLVNGSFAKISVLPKYVDSNEWLAANTLDFFNYINLFFGSVSEFCTAQACTVMNAGSNSCEYSWIDSQKRSVKIPAPQYIDYVMASVQTSLNDETIFPTKADMPFPKDFHATVKSIFKQLFRVLAHIYHSHYDTILHLSAEAHLNTLFAHFVCFARCFDLIDKKDMAPMAEYIQLLEELGRI